MTRPHPAVLSLRCPPSIFYCCPSPPRVVHSCLLKFAGASANPQAVREAPPHDLDINHGVEIIHPYSSRDDGVIIGYGFGITSYGSSELDLSRAMEQIGASNLRYFSMLRMFFLDVTNLYAFCYKHASKMMRRLC